MGLTCGSMGRMVVDLRADWLTERVLALTIDRPQRRNVLGHELLSALAVELETNGPRAGAIVLRGAGGSASSAEFDLDHPFDRIMHGTDHPFWPMPLGRRVLDQLDLSPEDRAKIEHQNAERLFGIHLPPREGH